ncbi:hypothetical protein [Mycobacterium sp.]|uniref:hypothetical protein n=1 Tax=Mycobacterium sp. TaxID=1785 RepID=UPI003F9D556D
MVPWVAEQRPAGAACPAHTVDAVVRAGPAVTAVAAVADQLGIAAVAAVPT